MTWMGRKATAPTTARPKKTTDIRTSVSPPILRIDGSVREIAFSMNGPSKTGPSNQAEIATSSKIVKEACGAFMRQMAAVDARESNELRCGYFDLSARRNVHAAGIDSTVTDRGAKTESKKKQRGRG